MTAVELFGWIYIAGLTIGGIVRKYYSARYWKSGFTSNLSGPLEYVLVVLPAIGFILPLITHFSSFLNFADYSIPRWGGWFGTAVYVAALWLLWRAHYDLGDNFSPFRQIREEHRLITGGIYERIRHPMYAAHWIWAFAQVLLIPNWIAGPSLLVTMLPIYFYRVPREERMLCERFGDEYRRYMKQTGRLIPRDLRTMKRL